MNRLSRALLAASLLLSCAGCGDEETATTPKSRIGEACQDSLDCKDELLCLSTEMRCVRTCTPGSDECGIGVPCQPADQTGYCPLPPAS